MDERTRKPVDAYSYVNLTRFRHVHEEWKAPTRPVPGPGNPLARPYDPTPEMFVLAEEEPEEGLAPVN